MVHEKNNLKLSTTWMNQEDLVTCGHYPLDTKLMLFALLCATTESCSVTKHAIKT